MTTSADGREQRSELLVRNSPTRYGVVTKTLHWATFVLIAWQFATGLTGNVDDDLHGSIGVLILVLVALRLAWRWTTPLPDWAPTLSERERRFVHWNERFLYLFIVAKVVTGLFFLGADGDDFDLLLIGEMPRLWFESDFWEDFFESAHAWAGYLLLGAIAAHVGLVLKHQFFDRDRLAHRMLPWTRQ